jgi:hypothetical protein
LLESISRVIMEGMGLFHECTQWSRVTLEARPRVGHPNGLESLRSQVAQDAILAEGVAALFTDKT